jgi:hypothetical protein
MNPKMPLKFIANCYGQYELMIWESRDCWLIFGVGSGKSIEIPELLIPNN